MTKCAECKVEVVHYHGNQFCKECSKIFYEGENNESIKQDKTVGNR